MSFNLKVTKGAGMGADFPIDQAEARLGRTADNDIVVKDSGASRSHARVFQKGPRYFVEDMKSANGTKVNNAVINGTSKEVKSGDTITIGEVVFTFSIQDETMLKNPGPATPSRPPRTRPCSRRRPIRPPRSKHPLSPRFPPPPPRTRHTTRTRRC